MLRISNGNIWTRATQPSDSKKYRDSKKVKQKTIANISGLPEDLREIISKSLKGEMFVPAM